MTSRPRECRRSGRRHSEHERSAAMVRVPVPDGGAGGRGVLAAVVRTPGGRRRHHQPHRRPALRAQGPRRGRRAEPAAARRAPARLHIQRRPPCRLFRPRRRGRQGRVPPRLSRRDPRPARQPVLERHRRLLRLVPHRRRRRRLSRRRPRRDCRETPGRPGPGVPGRPFQRRLHGPPLRLRPLQSGGGHRHAGRYAVEGPGPMWRVIAGVGAARARPQRHDRQLRRWPDPVRRVPRGCGDRERLGGQERL